VEGKPLKVIGLNASGTWKQRCELSTQLQELHIDVVLLRDPSKTPWKVFHSKFSFLLDWMPPGKKRIPHNHVDLCYMCDMYTWQRQSLFIRENPILSSEKILRKGYHCNGSVYKKRKLCPWASWGLVPKWMAVNCQSVNLTLTGELHNSQSWESKLWSGGP
jgi:hypothetical protein